MLKPVFSLVFVLFCAINVFSQSGDLIVHGVSPDLYVTHNVAPRENWYSVGRLYNLSPKEIAPLNGKTLANPLNIGDQLKVPLTSGNFSQNDSKASDETLIPVYHVVQDKEWMYRVSANYNKVPVETLERWNKLGKDGAKAGAKIIIGYLKVKKDQAPALANNTGSTNASPVVSTPATTAPVSQPPVSQAPVSQQPVADNKKPEVLQKSEPTTEPKATLPPATSTTAESSQPAAIPAGDSYFKTLYEPEGKSASGVAGVFKSISGWQDKKFYALMNNVNVGTIIRVTNPTTNKSLYAKVLGQLPEMKESNGLALRISDAAAAELGATVTKFNVQVGY